jgi:hypothetical protein
MPIIKNKKVSENKIKSRINHARASWLFTRDTLCGVGDIVSVREVEEHIFQDRGEEAKIFSFIIAMRT